MKNTIDLTKNKIAYNEWKWYVMGRQKDTLIISSEQKGTLERTGEYDTFENECKLRSIKIEVLGTALALVNKEE